MASTLPCPTYSGLIPVEFHRNPPESIFSGLNPMLAGISANFGIYSSFSPVSFRSHSSFFHLNYRNIPIWIQTGIPQDYSGIPGANRTETGLKPDFIINIEKKCTHQSWTHDHPINNDVAIKATELQRHCWGKQINSTCYDFFWHLGISARQCDTSPVTLVTQLSPSPSPTTTKTTTDTGVCCRQMVSFFVSLFSITNLDLVLTG